MTAVSEPSTSWQEVIDPDEDARFARQAELIADVQRRTNADHGVGRALHRRQVLGLIGTLDVAAELPEPAAHGLFARPGRHEVLLRLSNGAIHPGSDRVPDIRGFAIKVRNVGGPGALGSDTTEQHFLLINHPVFAMPGSAEFVGLVHSSAQGRIGILRFAVSQRGLFGAPGLLRQLNATLGRRFSGFATETFWSAAPLACGPYAVRLRLVPVDPAPASPDLDRAQDVTGRLATGPLTWDLQVQFFTDEATTPIERPDVDWPTPYVTVARLTVSAQDPAERDAVQAEAEAAAFDPWTALAEHRPLGEVMRARKAAYRASQLGRGSS